MGNGPIGMNMQPQMDPMSQPGSQPGGMPMGELPQALPGATPEGPNPAAPDMQPQSDMGTYGANEGSEGDDQIKSYIDSALTDTNLAKKLMKQKAGKNKQSGEDILKEMGNKIVEGYLADEVSREPWMDMNQEWMKLALLVREQKTFPWPKAANVKYPLLATAAMQFSARAYPALVPSDGHLVKTRVTQKNPEDQIYEAAERVSQHMSFQLLERIPQWEEDMDKLLMTLPISGTCFKKTYHNGVLKKHMSTLVYPEDLCVNYYASSLEKAYRKTEILRKYTDNDIVAKVNNNEEFLDLDYGTPTQESARGPNKSPNPATKTNPPPTDKSTPHTFLACHTYWDLDDDGYEEPYIITVHKETRQVARIIARWCLDGIHKNDEDDSVKYIEAVEYFTSFTFIPNPDGSIYGLGFGLLMGPLNEAVNTLANQLLDAGTLNNMQSGFIGKGLRLRMGVTSLQPGEFKVVNATAEDLQKGVFVMPSKEPSSVLFQLMNLLISSGNQLASIAEIFVGKMPGQNTPATTTQETIQQGMAVFTAIYKRVYRSLAKEYKKLYWLNKITEGSVEEESKLCGMKLERSDYDLPEWTIIPGADPTGDSATVRMAKLQQVGQLIPMGTIDPMIYTRMVLDANEIPNAQKLMKQPQPPPPDPKAQQAQQEMQQSAQEHQQNMQSSQQKAQTAQQLAQIDEAKKQTEFTHTQQMAALREQGMKTQQQHDNVSETIRQHKEMMDGQLAQMKAHAKTIQDVHHAQQKHEQGVVHTQQKHHQTLTLAAQKARQEKRNKPSPK